MIPLSGFLVSILWPHWPCYCDRYIITVISTSTSFHLCESKGWQSKNNIFTKQKHMKPKWPTSIFDMLLPRLSIFWAKVYIFLVSPRQKPCSRWLNTLGKIGLQCVLGVLCLNLLLLVGMLSSNISIWELNYYKWKGRQVITTFKWKMYGRILFTYFTFISNNNWSLLYKKCIHGQSHVTFRCQILELKLFLTYFS